MLPLPFYTHPRKGPLNLACMLPPWSNPTDLGPKSYVAYGRVGEGCVGGAHGGGGAHGPHGQGEYDQGEGRTWVRGGRRRGHMEWGRVRGTHGGGRGGVLRTALSMVRMPMTPTSRACF